MTDLNASTALTPPSPAPVSLPADAPESFSDARQAMNYMASLRDKREAEPAVTEPAASADPATAGNTELSDEDNAAPAEQATGETQEDAPAEQPPRALPRSWTKDQTEHWNKLDPVVQDFLLEQDRKASAEVRRVQNETAEKLKGLSAKEQQAEQARQNYETQAKAAFQALLREQQRDFPDVKTVDDVVNLSKTDPLRYIQWQAHQQELHVHAKTVEDAETRATTQKSEEWKSFRAKEDALAIEHIPDLGDKAKAPKIMEKAVALLQDVGFKPEELGGYDSGEKLSLFDHRVQRLIFEALSFRDLQAAKTAVLAKPVPPVQRPGVKPPTGQANSERLQALATRFNNSGDVKDAAALLVARRAATRRSS